jgi:hypothetical protein
MNWMNDLIKKYPLAALIIPTVLSGFSFFGHLFSIVSDGTIDPQELHGLMSSANCLETLLLIMIMMALRQPRKK